jgi:hypothetical protein
LESIEDLMSKGHKIDKEATLLQFKELPEHKKYKLCMYMKAMK